MPVEWMLAVLRDPEAEQHHRDLMAIQSAPYLHAKLNAVAVSSLSDSHFLSDNANANVLQILSVPRGCRVQTDGTGAITIDGEAAELKPIEPFTGTPALTDQRDHHKQRDQPTLERLEVIEVDASNVTRLDFDKRDGDDEPPDAA